jgi:hypothetical protein
MWKDPGFYLPIRHASIGEADTDINFFKLYYKPGFPAQKKLIFLIKKLNSNLKNSFRLPRYTHDIKVDRTRGLST